MEECVFCTPAFKVYVYVAGGRGASGQHVAAVGLNLPVNRLIKSDFLLGP